MKVAEKILSRRDEIPARGKNGKEKQKEKKGGNRSSIDGN